MFQGKMRNGLSVIVALLFVLSLSIGRVEFAGQSVSANQSEPAVASTGFSWCLVDESGNETQMVASSLQELADTGIVRIWQDGSRFSFVDGRSRPGNCTGTPTTVTPTATVPPVTETPTADIPEMSAISLDCSGLVTFSVTNASSIQDGQQSAVILIVTNDPEQGVINVGGTYLLTLTTGQSDYAIQLSNTEYWPTDVPIFARAYTHDVQAAVDSGVIDCGGATETPEPTTPVGTETPTAEPTTEPTEIPSTETPSVTPTSSATVTPTTTATPTVTPTVTPTPKPRIFVTPKNVVPGQSVDISVTNFDANEPVRVRWKVGTKWVQVGIIATDGSGAGTIAATVPGNVAAGANSVRADGANRAQQTNAVIVTIPGPPAVALSTTRTTVNAGVSFTAEHFLPNSTISITWRRPGGSTVSLGSVTTDSSGAATGSFVVPATEGGSANSVIFASGSRSVSLPFNVAPRIKVIPATASRGESVEVSLRGYGKQETVRIRWLVNGRWVTLVTITTSNTGSANVIVTVPANAASGQNSVRGDGTTFRQQTNAVTITP